VTFPRSWIYHLCSIYASFAEGSKEQDWAEEKGQSIVGALLICRLKSFNRSAACLNGAAAQQDFLEQ